TDGEADDDTAGCCVIQAALGEATGARHSLLAGRGREEPVPHASIERASVGIGDDERLQRTRGGDDHRFAIVYRLDLRLEAQSTERAAHGIERRREGSRATESGCPGELCGERRPDLCEPA